MTIEQYIDEGYAVVEYPPDKYTVNKTATVYSLENGKLKTTEISGDDYNAWKFLYVLSFLIRHGVEIIWADSIEPTTGNK